MINLPTPVIYAHRGASAYAPENTLAAFRLAVEQGADGIELDAKLSRDGHVVVIHDQTVNRTTGAGGRIDELDLYTMKLLDAGSWFSDAFTGEGIPTLNEVFDAVGRQVVINVELTNYRTPNDELVEKVIALVIKHQLEEYVLFSSFHPVTVLKARRLMPSIQTALLTVPGRAGVIGRSMAGRWMAPDLIHPYFSDVNAKFVRRQHRSGRKVNVWTVNREEDMRRMVQAGVDGLITDDVLMARRVLEEE